MPNARSLWTTNSKWSPCPSHTLVIPFISLSHIITLYWKEGSAPRIPLLGNRDLKAKGGKHPQTIHIYIYIRIPRSRCSGQRWNPGQPMTHDVCLLWNFELAHLQLRTVFLLSSHGSTLRETVVVASSDENASQALARPRQASSICPLWHRAWRRLRHVWKTSSCGLHLDLCLVIRLWDLWCASVSW